MCGRATLRIVLSTPCMMFASMIEIVIMPRLGTGANASPLTADAPRAASSRQAAPHPLAAQLLHASADHRKVVRGTGSGALATQFLHACADHRKIVSGAGSGHVSSVFL